MTIGEHHPYKLINGKLHRLCYRNKWLCVNGEPMDPRYYEGEETRRGVPSRYYKILIQGGPRAGRTTN
jgi:hypothetical protein